MGGAPNGEPNGERPDMPEDSNEEASSVFTISGIFNNFSHISELTTEVDTLKPGETQTVILPNIKESLSRLVIESPGWKREHFL